MSFLDDMVSVPEGSSANVGYELYKRLQYAKKLTGMGIFAMGGILARIKHEELWVGYAESWAEFCAAEAFSYSYAQTAIRTYDKYVVELGLPEETIERLAARDYTALDSATRSITLENSEEWIHKLLTLARQDILKEVRESHGEESLREASINKVVAAYRRLDHDERAEFCRRIAINVVS